MSSRIDDPVLLHSVQNSVRYGWREMQDYALAAEKPVKFIGMYAAFDLFPFLKKNPSSIGLLPEPDNSLQEFWRETSAVCCYQFGPLEKELLGRDGGAPILFLTGLEMAARDIIVNKGHLAEKMEFVINEITTSSLDPRKVEQRLGWLAI